MGDLRELIPRRRARLALPRTKPLLSALRKADEAREHLREAGAAIEACLKSAFPKELGSAHNRDARDMLISDADLTRLQTAWVEFHEEGGVTATDFADWLEGKPLVRLNGKIGRAKKHLRLVSTRRGLSDLPLRIRRKKNDGPPEAA